MLHAQLYFLFVLEARNLIFLFGVNIVLVLVLVLGCEYKQEQQVTSTAIDILQFSVIGRWFIKVNNRMGDSVSASVFCVFSPIVIHVWQPFTSALATKPLALHITDIFTPCTTLNEFF